MSYQPINILIVSDDENDFKNLNSEFRQNKVVNPLFLVFNGSEPTELLRNKIVAHMGTPEPSIILIDISMPDMNGLKHLKWIKAEKDLKNVKVFVITSSDDVKKQVEAEGHEVADYIEKPVSFPKFASAISKVKSSWMFYEESSQ